MLKKYLCIAMAISISLLSLTGCQLNSNNGKSPYKDFLVVDVFVSQANFQGIQSGWFGKIVKDKFNMELNIIAPNESSGGDTLLEMRSAAGSVGDLILCGTEKGNMRSLIEEGLVLDMSKYLEDKDIMRYSKAITMLNTKLANDGIYAIPSDISTLPANKSSEGPELTYGPYLRWDIYSAIGYPQMTTLEDLLPVLQRMQKEYPYTESGNPTYAFSFFKNWDGTMMTAAKQPACFYGYDELGFVLAKADGSDYQNILDANSIYMRVLKLYFDANQMGLVDPDSYVQDYDDVFEKYKDGSILYSPWPWQGQSAYNTAEHKAEGKGYMLAPIDDMQIFSYGCNPEGNQKYVLSIGSKTEDPQRMADFIDWMYSPEGISIVAASPTQGTAGPEGLTWELKEDGPHLTEFGKQAFLESGAEVPESWGGGTWADGVSQLNFRPVSLSDLHPNGFPYYYNQWESVLAMEDSALDLDWKAYMGANSSHDYLDKNNQIIVAPGSGYIPSEMNTEVATIRELCKKIVVEYSWKMVFAPDEETFYSLKRKMQEEANALGYEGVYAVDLQAAKEQDAARKAAVALSED